MKKDFQFRCDYHDGYHASKALVGGDFILDRDDIKALKKMAKAEGRTLKSFLAGRLKRIVKENNG